jgi:ATP-dependent Clp protease protease subunit
MDENNKQPAFTALAREQLLAKRILVLDGVLDDDNGTLLAAQLMALATDDAATDIAL